MIFGTANAETSPLDSAVRLLAVGVSANCARTSAQSAQARAAHLEPGTSTPSGLVPNWHSGLDAAACDTANTFALPAPVGSAQPIAHHDVLPIEFHARLAVEIDRALCGKSTKRPSLCDLVGPARALRIRCDELQAENAELRGRNG